MTVREWIKAAQEQLRLDGCEDYETDARLMVCGIRNISPGRLFAVYGEQLQEEEQKALDERLHRRRMGEPLQYIEGKAYFMGLEFYVDPRVLIPRQDTETLAEAALERLKGMKHAKVLDLCTGSGALAVSIAEYAKNVTVFASDISLDALSVAEKNALHNHVSIRFFQGDGFQPFEDEMFDMVVCNPPYLTKEDMNSLQREVREEPPLALFGGDDGLEFYRRFFGELPAHLKCGGVAMFEVGAGQAQEVLEIAVSCVKAAESGIISDLCGIERVVWVRSL